MATLELTKTDKEELKKLIRIEMATMRNELDDAISNMDKEYQNKELDEDMDCCTYQAMYYSDKMCLYFHMYDNELANSNPRKFWDLGGCYRDCMWDCMEENLSPELFKKITDWLQTGNK